VVLVFILCDNNLDLDSSFFLSFEITATIVATVIADDATCTSDEFPYLFVASLAVDNIILCYFSPIALYFM